MPVQLYHDEWIGRKMRNRVHLTLGGCLGPCALSNVVMLIFDGHPVWFQAVDSEAQALAIYDYIDQMIAANRYLSPPPELEEFVFDGFAWTGQRYEEITKVPQAREVPLAERGFLFLTHADTDLLMLSRVVNELPSDFRPIQAENLMMLRTAEQVNGFLNEVLPATQVVIVRLLGGKSSFEHGFQQLRARCLDEGKALLVLSGTDVPDPELTAASTVSVPVIHDAYSYFRAGGNANMGHMFRFLSDHLLATGLGYDAPQAQPTHGIYHSRLNGDTSLQSWLQQADLTRPTVGILFYRSHWISGNTDFIDALIEEIERRGGNALPVFTGSLKQTKERDGIKWPVAFDFFLAPETAQVPGTLEVTGTLPEPPDKVPGTLEVTGTLPDVLISTMSFAMGGVNPDGPTLSDWSVAALEALDVPVLQAIASGTRYQSWEVSGRGLNPLDTAMNVALPEFDGRIITVPISFKGEVQAATTKSQPPATSNGKQPRVKRDSQNGKQSKLRPVSKALNTTITKYIPVPDRVERVIGLAMRFATLRRKPNAQKRVAFILTNSPGKAAKIGNAVGLDAPASLMRLFDAMQAEGYSIENLPPDGDALIHALIERCSYDTDLLTEWQLEHAAGRVDENTYRSWFNELTEKQRGSMDRKWGAAPGEAFYHDGHLSFAGLELGNVFVALQPPRGYGMDPDAIYHTSDLAPPHHYHALYRWLAGAGQLEGGWGADAIVHVGKHGTLEWLPGKGVGLSNECFPDSFIADMPFFYPFILNNPGEGAQAKRRTHAVIIDHLVPPMMQADLYGELTELAQLVDEYYQLEATDPTKLPLLQQQIWELIQQASLDADMKAIMQAQQDHGDHVHEWDDSLTDDGTPVSLVQMRGKDVAHLMEDIDGYLCELQGLQIRDGLHILGYAPEGEQLVGLLQALTRLPNLDIPSLRASVAAYFGLDLDALLDAPGQKLAPTQFLHEAQDDITRGGELAAVGGKVIITASDAIETIDTLCHELLSDLQTHNFDTTGVDYAILSVLGDEEPIKKGDRKGTPLQSPISKKGDRKGTPLHSPI
ncbi:MAG: cobaltochelatase subunit CobN, partial [Ardenticatenaceae bacterium]